MDKYLLLNNFRNHKKTEIKIDDGTNILVLTGKNGEGKTNILEALSLFAGGKGLRHCTADEITGIGEQAWKATLSLDEGIFSCGYFQNRKFYKESDKNVRNLSSFAKKHYVLWMTYETDRLFVEPPANRRHFIDMFASSKFPEHDEDLRTYEKLTKERIKILKEAENNIDERTDSWMRIIEERIAKVGIKVVQNRIEVTKDIEAGQLQNSDFPLFTNKMVGNLELFIDDPNVLTKYQEELFQRRTKDFFSRSTTLGPNRSDWQVWHLKKNISATQCSAGEQKMITLGVFLSFIRQNLKNDKRMLILLLDDVIAHLDSSHRLILFKHIKALQEFFSSNGLKIMIWLSGTSKSLFSEFADSAVFYSVKDGAIEIQ